MVLILFFNSVVNQVPDGQSPIVWFMVQICSNLIFIYVGYALIRHFNRFHKTGFFEKSSFKVFNTIIFSCISLGILAIIKLAFSNFYPLPLEEYNSLWGTINLVTYLLIDTVTFKEPQTMYLLIGIVLWTVKQFTLKAIAIKSENEEII